MTFKKVLLGYIFCVIALNCAAQDSNRLSRQLPLSSVTTGESTVGLNFEQMMGQFIKQSIADSRVARPLPDAQVKSIPVQGSTLPPPQSARPRLKLTPSGSGNMRFIPLPSQQARNESTANPTGNEVSSVNIMPVEQASFSIMNNAMGSLLGSSNVDFIE